MPEPEMWPIGKAFACFVNAYVFKPVYKYYYYHGMKMICTKLGKMKPFECRRFNPKEMWEVIYDFDFYNPLGWFYFYRKDSDYLPSELDDVCKDKWFDGKVRYWFFEIETHVALETGGIYFKWDSGKECKMDQIIKTGTFMYKAKFDFCWKKYKTSFAMWKPIYKSHAKIWRSKTGKFPGYYPVPEEEIIR